MIRTEVVTNEPPYSFSDCPSWESVEPVIEVGDIVTIRGVWDEDSKGVVTAVTDLSGLFVRISDDYPCSYPAYPADLFVGRHRVVRVERGELIWNRTEGKVN